MPRINNNNFQTNNILIVEGDEYEAEIITHSIESLKINNSKITSTCDSNGALEELSKDSYRLMLVDYELSDTNGVDLLAKVRKKYPKMIRILISGISNFDIALEAINKARIHKYIVKPWNDDELQSLVQSIFKVRRDNGKNGKNEKNGKNGEKRNDDVGKALLAIKKILNELESKKTDTSYKQTVAVEFSSTLLFNQFSSEIQIFNNVKIDDVHIFENKYIVTVAVYKHGVEII